MTTAKLAARVTALETRVETLERIRKQVYASIHDNPVSVENAWALKEILGFAKIFAEAHTKDPFGSPLHNAAQETLGLLAAIEVRSMGE